MDEKVGVIGAISAAILASVCCIGPVVLAGLGIGAVAAAQKFAPYRPWFLAITAIFLGLGFCFSYRKPKQTRCESGACEMSRFARWGRPLSWTATAIVVALVTFPHYYAPLRAALDLPRQAVPLPLQGPLLATVELKVSGMTCAGCAVSVRNALLETPGVTSAEVNFESAHARVRYDAGKVSVSQLLEAVSKTGFKASLRSEALHKEAEGTEK